MWMLILVLSLILGCMIGFGLAYTITAILISKSNNIGDSKASFYTFTLGKPLNVIWERNNLRDSEL